LEGEEWRDLYQSFDAPYKIGLSATIWPDDCDQTGYAKSDIWVRAATGPIRYEITIDTLVAGGWLIAPEVILVRSTKPVVPKMPWTAVRPRILYSRERNSIVVKYAQRYVREGLRVLIIVGLVEHMKAVVGHLEDEGLTVSAVTGAVTSLKKRNAIIADFLSGRTDVLIGTVFGEGVDLPAVEVVINAEGGQSRKAARQRFRNLTPAPGKTKAIFVDIIDANNQYLSNHSLARIQEYKKEATFKLSVVNAED